jgi:hypothetical protein
MDYTPQEALRLAQNPTTPAEQLRMLSLGMQYGDLFEKIHDAIAGNPNTPPDILAEPFMFRFPSLLTNPAFPLLWIENPYFLSAENLAEILTLQSNIPDQFLDFCCNYPNSLVSTTVQSHIAFAGEADVNWREEAGVFLAKLPWHPQEIAWLKKFHLLPDWILPHCHESLSIGKQPEQLGKEKHEEILAFFKLKRRIFIRDAFESLTEDIIRSKIVGSKGDRYIDLEKVDILWEISERKNKDRARTQQDIFYCIHNPIVSEDFLKFPLKDGIDTSIESDKLQMRLLNALHQHLSAKTNDYILIRSEDRQDKEQEMVFYITPDSGFQSDSPFLYFLVSLRQNKRAVWWHYHVKWYIRLLTVLLGNLHPNDNQYFLNDSNRFVRAAAQERAKTH